MSRDNIHVKSISNQIFLWFFMLYNSSWNNVQTLILIEKILNNIPKLSLNMSLQVNILRFSLEVPFTLHLVQLWLVKHQLTCMILGAERCLHLISKYLIIINWWIEKYLCHLKK